MQPQMIGYQSVSDLRVQIHCGVWGSTDSRPSFLCFSEVDSLFFWRGGSRLKETKHDLIQLLNSFAHSFICGVMIRTQGIRWDVQDTSTSSVITQGGSRKRLICYFLFLRLVLIRFALGSQETADRKKVSAHKTNLTQYWCFNVLKSSASQDTTSQILYAAYTLFCFKYSQAQGGLGSVLKLCRTI